MLQDQKLKSVLKDMNALLVQLIKLCVLVAIKIKCGNHLAKLVQLVSIVHKLEVARHLEHLR